MCHIIIYLSLYETVVTTLLDNYINAKQNGFHMLQAPLLWEDRLAF